MGLVHVREDDGFSGIVFLAEALGIHAQHGEFAAPAAAVPPRPAAPAQAAKFRADIARELGLPA